MLFLWLKKTNNLDTAKASQQSDIPTKILKQNSEIISQNTFVEISISEF